MTNDGLTLRSIKSGHPLDATKNFAVEDRALLSVLTDERPSDKMSVEAAYRKVAWFRRCVDIRAEVYAGMPFTIRRKSTGTVLFDSEGFRPPPDNLEWAASLPDLFRLEEICILLYGRAYWRPLTEGGWPTGIQHLYPGSIREVYNEDGTVSGYKRKIVNPKSGAEQEKDIPKEELVAFYNRSPLTEVDGSELMPLAEAARVNADVLFSLDKWLDSHLDRGLLPATIIAVPANTPPDKRAEFQSWWDRLFRGKNNAGRQKVLNADAVEIHKVGEGLNEFGIEDLIKPHRQAIATLLGIPMTELTSDAANRATAFQADESLYTKAIIPRGRRSQLVYNRDIFGPLGLYFRWEFDRIKALQRANLETARSLEKITDLVTTRDESRNFIGLEPLTEEQKREMEEAKPKAPAPNAPTEFEPMDDEAKAELQRWRWKAERKGADVPWEPESIPEYVYKAVRTRLETGDSIEEAFSPPYFGM